jgi:hypothetical protein
MNPALIFWAIFLALIAMIIYMDYKFFILRNVAVVYKPYSWSRVQLAWWTVIVMSSFISILIARKQIATFNTSTLILLGISAATTATARMIDISDDSSLVRSADKSQKPSFVLDILSDESNINIQRFQTAVFNLVFGIWFINEVLTSIASKGIDEIMPLITNNNLILLGLSSATYAALKTTENKTGEQKHEAEAVASAESFVEEPAVG